VFLDVALLAQRTEAIMPLVYYPYVVIFLMIAARSPYFAGWHWPGSVLAILSTLLLITVYDYLTLRQAAERVRADSVQALQDTMLSLPRGDDRRDRLQTLKEVIQNTNSGAFALFSRNPIVGAVLLPCAGLGAWALFRLFTG
jgi:hypothetical protein